MKFSEYINEAKSIKVQIVKSKGKYIIKDMRGKVLDAEGFDDEYEAKKWVGKQWPNATIKGEKRGM